MCTSFVTYSNKVFYGMNLDLLETDMFLKVENGNKGNFFCLYADVFNLHPVVGMHENGNFSNFQMMYPDNDDDLPYIEDVPLEVIETHSKIESVKLLMDFISGKIDFQAVEDLDNKSYIVSPENFSLHSIFCNKNGKAMILENVNWQLNKIMLKEAFFVMTNFINSKFLNKRYEDACGVGDDRYKKVSKYLEENIGKLSINTGLDLLKSVYLNDEKAISLCSMVFVPEDKEVYFVQRLNREKVWKVSIEDGTISRWNDSGVEDTRVIGKEGIKLKDLI